MLLLTLSISLIALYAVWCGFTSHVKDMGPHWGPDALALSVARVCTWLAALVSLDCSIEFDGEPPSLDQRFVAMCSPHGCFPMAMCGVLVWAFRPGLEGISKEGCDAWRARFMGASVLFSLPLLRELLMLTGVRDASKRNCRKFLAAGHTIAINPGGIWEMVRSVWHKETVYCQRGLGFVRIAMEGGHPLVPCYSFGENQIFRGSKLLLGPRDWVARKLRVGLPIFTGRWGVPGIPLPTKVTFVVGRAVPTGPPNANPTDAEVDEVFARYVDELCRLFVAHADRCLVPEVAKNGLRVVRVGHGVVREVFPPSAQ